MRRACLAAALLVAPWTARAAANCTLTLGSINLGSYDVFAGGDLAGNVTLSYVCSAAASGPIYIDLGTGGSGTYAQRLASNGAAPQLRYNLYTDAANQIVWGDGNGTTGEYYLPGDPGKNTTYVVPVFGRIPARQDVAVGTYTDTLVATIYWIKKNVLNSASVTVPVTVAVPSSCTIGASNIGFGTYDPVGANATAPLPATGAVTTTCTRGAATTIGLDAGRNPAGAQRRMADAAGDLLPYGLFQDGGYSNAWGTSGTGLLAPPAAPSFLPRTFTVYGQIPAGQDPAVGSYGDTVTATVTF